MKRKTYAAAFSYSWHPPTRPKPPIFRRRKRHHQTSPPPPPSPQPLIPSLPDEISLQILTRLPVRSLIKSTTVSKSWNFHIKSSSFIRSQLSTSLSNPHYTHHCLLHAGAHSHDNLFRTPLPSLLRHSLITPKTIPHPRTHPLQFPELIGTVNGLVCISLDYDYDYFFFWNPCLRKFRQIPKVKIAKSKRESPIRYGFGYDVVGDDYKLVAILCVRKESDVYENDVMVYSANNCYWKKVKGFKEGFYVEDYGVFVNGRLHWATRPRSPLVGDDGMYMYSYKWSIVSVDVGDESCGVLDTPDFGVSKYNYELGVIWECICVLCNHGKTNVDFWVMKVHGVRESWTKFASISCLSVPRWECDKPPFVLLNNGKMLVFEPRYNQIPILYNLQDDSRTTLDIYRFYCCLSCLVYVESLVLP